MNVWIGYELMPVHFRCFWGWTDDDSDNGHQYARRHASADIAATAYWAADADTAVLPLPLYLPPCLQHATVLYGCVGKFSENGLFSFHRLVHDAIVLESETMSTGSPGYANLMTQFKLVPNWLLLTIWHGNKKCWILSQNWRWSYKGGWPSDFLLSRIPA